MPSPPGGSRTPPKTPPTSKTNKLTTTAITPSRAQERIRSRTKTGRASGERGRKKRWKRKQFHQQPWWNSCPGESNPDKRHSPGLLLAVGRAMDGGPTHPNLGIGRFVSSWLFLALSCRVAPSSGRACQQWMAVARALPRPDRPPSFLLIRTRCSLGAHLGLTVSNSRRRI